MSPRVPGPVRPSPLTNRKLLAVFKGKRPNILNIEDVSLVGERYMQKSTSIRFVLRVEINYLSIAFRRFAASFSQLRVEHRQLKCSRNTKSLSAFEEQEFAWPAKPDKTSLDGQPPPQDVEDQLEDVGDAGGQEYGSTGVTMGGRYTGIFSKFNQFYFLKPPLLFINVNFRHQ